MSRSLFQVLVACAVVAVGAIDCGEGPSGAPPAPPATSADAAPAPAAFVEAGFVEVPPRDVTVKGAAVHIGATARLFYNLRPADTDPDDKPIFFLFNGFAAEVVRAFGTGPMTVAEGGAVVTNPSSYTSFANLVYLEPRQSGYSYDLYAGGDASDGGAPGAADCAPGIFNEYVDAADVLLGALAFLEAHPQLRGPVYWVGESYAGVRITWILAYLRGRWDLASYADPVLQAKLAATPRATSLRAGQILLEAWVAGGAHTTAIAAECTDPVLFSEVSQSVTAPCTGTDACACAADDDRSPYNYTYAVEREVARETEASEAHIDPGSAAALLGVPLTSIPRLAAVERARGFKCTPPDSTIPAEDALVATLGALPEGQSYYVPFSPLLPGKETQPTTLDWRTVNVEGVAFVDNLQDVPTFATAGERDLVVPPRALAPALTSILGASRVDDGEAGKLGVMYPDGGAERFIDVFAYESAGHMVEMVQAADLSRDVQAWVGQLKP